MRQGRQQRDPHSGLKFGEERHVTAQEFAPARPAVAGREGQRMSAVDSPL